MIVGGGVIGTMHALFGRRAGYDVVHLEREADARGASVRNFGLVWVGGRAAGPELDSRCGPVSCGRRSRARSRRWPFAPTAR